MPPPPPPRDLSSFGNSLFLRLLPSLLFTFSRSEVSHVSSPHLTRSAPAGEPRPVRVPSRPPRGRPRGRPLPAPEATGSPTGSPTGQGSGRSAGGSPRRQREGRAADPQDGALAAVKSDDMKGALAEIIQLATLDSDPWVLMVADILKSFPDTGSLNLDLEEQNPNVQDILGELREKAPLKGIPKQAPFRSPTAPSVFSPAGNRTPMPPSRTPLRKERGVKLLHISELDTVGAGREAKRRRKTLDTEVVEKPAKEETVIENATPDYAAGLVSTQKLGALNSEPSLPSTSYLPATPSVVPASSYIPSSETPPAPPSREASRPPEEPSTPSPALPAQFKQRAPMYNSGLSPATPTPTPAAPASPLTPTTPPAVTPAAQAPPVAMVAPQTQPPAQQQPKKNLSLTREQMFAAQEMFKTANKVTRPEKALILGFMAGSRENPCQEQGDVIQIKLSEHTEDLPKSDGQGSTTMLVDTVFEMNYATGQWTRFKKYKPMANVS
ncbi:negative elongation factor A isoform X3 [Myotis yumanensis]|uniref:negative elongation factor A isoform X3 n=1 Tax=Myotis yumanensis TaxID=159337 RepID=UPI0038CFE927